MPHQLAIIRAGVLFCWIDGNDGAMMVMLVNAIDVKQDDGVVIDDAWANDKDDEDNTDTHNDDID